MTTPATTSICRGSAAPSTDGQNAKRREPVRSAETKAYYGLSGKCIAKLHSCTTSVVQLAGRAQKQEKWPWGFISGGTPQEERDRRYQ